MSISDWSIRRRLTFVILSITLLALGVGFTVVAVRQVESFRRDRLATTAVIADVVGNYSVASLAFGDAEDAGDVLNGLRSFPEIDGAALYDAHGVRFAVYARPGARPHEWPEAIRADAPPLRSMGDGVAEIRERIEYDGRFYGNIHLRASNGSLAGQIRSYLLTLGALILGLVALSVVAVQFLQRIIARPILQLAEVARRISAEEDVSIRVGGTDGGEIGVLSDGFNRMLAKLEARDRELRTSHGTLRALVDASPLAIIGIDAQRTVTLWNAEAAHIFGVKEAAARGRYIFDAVSDPSLVSMWERCLTQGGVAGSEIRWERRRDGRVKDLLVSAAALRASDDSRPGAVIVIADITERKLAEEALLEREAQLQRAQKMEVVGRLAGGVAHDFNNLLTVVMAACQLLKLRAGNRPELEHHIKNIQNAADRGSALTRRLLAFSKRQVVRTQVVDLGAVVADLEKMLRSVVGEHIQLRAELAKAPSLVEIDQGQLEQVLINLVLNARDAMPGGGELLVRTRVVDVTSAAGSGAEGIAGGPRRDEDVGDVSRDGGSWVAISVTDTGVGMAPDVVARVFEPFFTTKEHGTGLGLATAYHIARDFGGEITVDSDVGRGTTFTLWLPRVTAVADASETSSEHEPVRGRETVLLVEDEVELRALVRQILEDAGFDVVEATDGADALALVARGDVTPDLLLTDVVMPRMSGAQLARELTRRRPDLQVLYMSGYVGDALTSHGIDEGATVALINKPFTPDRLLRKVREVLDSRGQPRMRRPTTTSTPVRVVVPRS